MVWGSHSRQIGLLQVLFAVQTMSQACEHVHACANIALIQFNGAKASFDGATKRSIMIEDARATPILNRLSLYL